MDEWKSQKVFSFYDGRSAQNHNGLLIVLKAGFATFV
jgi:hypothetical protein